MKKGIIYIGIILIVSILGIGLYIFCNNIPYSEIDLNTMALEVTSINNDGNYIINYSNAEDFKTLLNNFEYIDGVCKCEADYVLKFSDDTVYYIDLTCNAIQTNGKQANISEEKMQEILNYINDKPENNSNETIEIIPNVK